MICTFICAAIIGASVQQDSQQKPFVERFDNAVLKEAVSILLDENQKHGPTILEVFINKAKDCPISDESRLKMAKSFGSGTELWANGYKDQTGRAPKFSVETLEGDSRKTVQNLIANDQYAKIINGLPELSEFVSVLDDIHKYVGQDLLSLPPKVAVVSFPVTPNGLEIRWYLFFRLVDNKWRWEYSVPYFSVVTAPAIRPGLFCTPGRNLLRFAQS